MPILNYRGKPITADDYGPRADRRVYDSDDRRDVEKVLRIFQIYGEAYNRLFSQHRQCVDVLNDRQWTVSEQAYAEKQNRTLLSINVTRPYAMQVAGMQRMARSDLRVEPFDRVDDPEIAEVAQKLLETVEYNSRQDIKDSLVFQDGMSGLGNWEVRIDYGQSPLGEVKVGRAEPFGVFYDIDSYDPLLDDCYSILRAVYMRPERIKSKFGKGSDMKFDEDEWRYWYEDLQSNPVDGFNQLLNPPLRLNGKYLVLELFERQSRATRLIVDKQTGQQIGQYPFESGSTQRFVEQYPEYGIIELQQPVIQSTCVMPYNYTRLGKTVEDYQHYPLVPFASIRNGTRLQDSSSFNYSMLGLQTELNLRHSNQQEYITRSLRGGYWIFEMGGGETLMHELDEFGYQIGRNFRIEGPPGSEPKPITPVNILPGEAFLESGDLNYFERVTGLTAAAITGGIDERGESGVKRKQRREESQTTLYHIIDDFNHQKALVASATLERVLSVMNPMTTVRVIGRDGNQQFINIAEDMINNLRDISKWDIRIMNGPFVTSQREMDNAKMLGLFELTTRIMPEAAKAIIPRLWRSSGIEDADEIADEIEKLVVTEAQTQAIMPTQMPTKPGASGNLSAVP